MFGKPIDFILQDKRKSLSNNQCYMFCLKLYSYYTTRNVFFARQVMTLLYSPEKDRSQTIHRDFVDIKANNTKRRDLFLNLSGNNLLLFFLHAKTKLENQP